MAVLKRIGDFELLNDIHLGADERRAFLGGDEVADEVVQLSHALPRIGQMVLREGDEHTHIVAAAIAHLLHLAGNTIETVSNGIQSHVDGKRAGHADAVLVVGLVIIIGVATATWETVHAVHNQCRATGMGIVVNATLNLVGVERRLREIVVLIAHRRNGHAICNHVGDAFFGTRAVATIDAGHQFKKHALASHVLGLSKHHRHGEHGSDK